MEHPAKIVLSKVVDKDTKEEVTVAHFVQGDIKFKVYHTDLGRTLGFLPNGDVHPDGATFDTLNDHLVTRWGQLNGFPVIPFNRELLRPLLMGLVQNTWYECIAGEVPDACVVNQRKRIANYERDLVGAVERKDKQKKERAPRADGLFQKQAQPIYRLVNHKLELTGQQLLLFNWFKKHKQGTRAQIVADLEADGFKANQPCDKVVMHYLNKWPKLGYIEKVGVAAENVAPPIHDEAGAAEDRSARLKDDAKKFKKEQVAKAKKRIPRSFGKPVAKAAAK